MLTYIEGTLLISNFLLIFFSVIYGLLIVKKKHKEESTLWVYFLIASALFFISEFLDILTDLLGVVGVGLLKALIRISFGVVVLFAFLSKYNTIEEAHKKH